VVAVGFVIPNQARVVRIGVALYALAMVASFALATPLGGNVVRLGALFAGPVLAALAWRSNRRALALLALPLVYWQWVAPVDDWARAAGDASVHERYYDGLIGFLGAQRGGPFRMEIPFTDNHWESRWVAPHVPLARGWVGEGPGGWTRLRLERPGPVVVDASFALGRVRASAPRCTD